MAELPEVFQAKDEPTMDQGFETIPPSWQPAVIVKSNFEKANSGRGQYLKLAFKIIEGQYKGRMVWAQLNLIHENDTTVQIAKRELSSICKALDLESVVDSEELHGNPMQIKIAIQPGTAKWPEKNVIKNYRSIDEAVEEETEDSNPFS